MNKEALLKHTTSYEEELLEDLKDPEEAKAYGLIDEILTKRPEKKEEE